MTKKATLVADLTVCALALLLGGVFGRHLYLVRDLIRSTIESAKSSKGENFSVVHNPITNRVTITITMPPETEEEENPFAAAGANLGRSFGGALMQMMAPAMEKALNDAAREKWDLYAMMVPYKVSSEVKKASPEQVAAMKRQAAEKKQAEERAAKAEIAAYMKEGLVLDNVHIADGERFGRPTKGVFGTVVNNGSKTLTEVDLRIYFLDENGKRIGETDYYPVLVTRFSMGDNSPLRPGYRRDFGYSVEDHAPSGWSQRIEWEITKLEFGSK